MPICRVIFLIGFALLIGYKNKCCNGQKVDAQTIERLQKWFAHCETLSISAEGVGWKLKNDGDWAETWRWHIERHGTLADRFDSETTFGKYRPNDANAWQRTHSISFTTDATVFPGANAEHPVFCINMNSEFIPENEIENRIKADGSGEIEALIIYESTPRPRLGFWFLGDPIPGSPEQTISAIIAENDEMYFNSAPTDDSLLIEIWKGDLNVKLECKRFGDLVVPNMVALSNKSTTFAGTQRLTAISDDVSRLRFTCEWQTSESSVHGYRKDLAIALSHCEKNEVETLRNGLVNDFADGLDVILFDRQQSKAHWRNKQVRVLDEE